MNGDAPSAPRAKWLSSIGRTAVLSTAVLLLGAATLVVGEGAASASPHARSLDYERACAVAKGDGVACMVLVRTNVEQRTAAEGPSRDGYGPSQLQSAYDLESASASDGAGKVVAVVDAYNDPDAVSDVTAYRSAWGLPACDTSNGEGCLTVVNQNGAKSPLPKNAGSTGWATEESLDVDMVSAICPLCRIYLVEGSAPSLVDLGTAVDSAVEDLHAEYVSNSYGANQKKKDPVLDKDYYDHPGVAVTASAGDSGYGVAYPAASRYVTSVGGTSLSKADTVRGWTEKVWSGTGSGCSKYESKPSWQTDSGCKKRTDNDVAAVADPGTGVAIYDTYDQGGWLEVGGTSVASPIIASVFALAGKPAKGSYPSSYPYSHRHDLYDVTSGSNGKCSPAYLCTGETGYDGPTGLGTPDGTAAFKS